jgi:hypothetical protein
MGRSTTAQLNEKDRHLTVSQHDTDAPILPVAQLEKLHQFYPDAVPWVIDEASKEGQFRREESGRINTFIFIERIAGLLAGFSIGAIALSISYLLAMAGHDWVASVIGGTTVVALVGAFIYGKKKVANKDS